MQIGTEVEVERMQVGKDGGNRGTGYLAGTDQVTPAFENMLCQQVTKQQAIDKQSKHNPGCIQFAATSVSYWAG